MDAVARSDERRHDDGDDATVPRQAAGPAFVAFGDGWRLLPHRPLPALDSPSARAYAVEGPGFSTTLFALVCDPAVPARFDALDAFREIRHPRVMRLVEHGAVDWPPVGCRTTVALFERPIGPRVGDEPGPPMSAGAIVRCVVAPAVEAVGALAEAGLTHRAIRPDNLFWADPEREAVVLGECVTAPPGHGQPAVYEPVASAAALPAGRQSGTVKDDLFALGVTVLRLAFGEQPGQGASPDQLLVDRLDFGSAAVLVGKRHLPPVLQELIRGLLADDPALRWGLSELRRWLRSERVIGHGDTAPGGARRSYRLGRSHYRTPAALAVGLYREPQAALSALRDGSVEDWLRTAMHDDLLADSIRILNSSAPRIGVARRRADDTLLALAAATLAPGAAIRYGEWAVMPEGIGTALAEAIASGRGPAAFAALIASDVIGRLPTDIRDRLPGRPAILDDLKRYVARPGLGSGVERCLYELNPRLPCLGPRVAAARPTDLLGLMQALEQASRVADGIGTPVDPHVAAFVASRLGRRAERLLVGTADETDRYLAEIRLLALVQSRADDLRFPGLTTWCARRAEPVVRRYRNRRLRKRLRAALMRKSATGRFDDLLALLDDEPRRRQDEQAFRAAVIEHTHNRQELEELVRAAADLSEAVPLAGRRCAAGVAMVVAVAMMALLGVTGAL